MNEEEVLAAIRMVIGGELPGVRLGIGDDAALVEGIAGDAVLTADMLVEGVDFVLERIAPRDLGRKAISVNLSDIAAMGASPRYVLVSLALPEHADVPWVVALYSGMREACAEHAVSIVGGDLSSASQVVVAVSVIGAVAPGGGVTRAGARVGDAIVVTGSLGGAAGGLAVSTADDGGRLALTEDGRALLGALDRPVARVAEGQFLASRGVTSMIDLSDGLSRDLHRLCRASQVGARIEAASIPLNPHLMQIANSLDVAASELALTGGEDFALLATMPASALAATRAAFNDMFLSELAVIGEVLSGEDVVLDTGTATVPLADAGWDHFDR